MRMRLPALLLLAAIAMPAGLRAQSVAGEGFRLLRADGNGIAALRRTVLIDSTAVPLGDALRAVMREAGLDLVFSSALPGLDRRVAPLGREATAAEHLLALVANSRLELLVSAAGQVVLLQRSAAEGDAVQRSVIAGTVRESTGGRAIAEVDVLLENTPQRATTDRSGRFVLRDVAPGEHRVIARRFGYVERVVAVHATGDTALIDITLDAAPTPLASVIVAPGTFGVMQQSLPPRQALTRQEIESQPQIGDDIFRAITRLPGVASMDLSAAFGVRGSTNQEVLLRLDGLELIEPYHLKDFDDALSIIDIEAIGGIDLATGGFGAQYGNRLAGVFDMRTVTVPPGPARTSVGVSLTNLRADSRGEFAAGRGRWLAAVRRGYLDLALELGGSDEQFSPTYWDVLGKVEMDLGRATVLGAHLLHASDRLSYRDESDDPDLDSEYGSSYAWLTLEAQPAGLTARAVAAVGRLRWERLGARARGNHHGAIGVRDERDYHFASIRNEWELQPTESLLTQWGFEARTQDAGYDYFGWGERYRIDDGVRYVLTDTTIAIASPGGTSTAAWLSQRVRPWPALTLEAGLRWDRHTHTGDDDITPRLAAAWSPGAGTTVRAAWGRYTQAMGLHELAARDGDTRFVPAAVAEHRVIGLEQSLPAQLQLRIEAYDIATDGVPPRFVNLDNTNEAFPEMTHARARIDPEEATAEGIEVMLSRRVVPGLEWAVMYARSRARERIDGRWIAGHRDQPHAFALDLAWRTRGRWRFALAWQARTGWPTTPVSLRVDTLGTDLFVSRTYGDYNTGRLPAYHRLDLRVAHEIPTRRGRIRFFIDMLNVYGRENARALHPWLFDLRNGQPIIRYEREILLPRLPSFGVNWQF